MNKYYKILHLKSTSSKEDVDKRYNELKESFDPKNNEGMEDFFQEELDKVNNAYEKIIAYINGIEEEERKEINQKKVLKESCEEDNISSSSQYITNETIGNEENQSNDIGININLTINTIEACQRSVHWSRSISGILFLIGCFGLWGLYQSYEEYQSSLMYYNSYERNQYFVLDKPKFYPQLILWALYLYFSFSLSTYLNRFSKNVKTLLSVNNKHNQSFEDAMSNLGKAFKIWVLLMICSICFILYYMA